MTVQSNIGQDGVLVMTVMVPTLDRNNAGDFRDAATQAVTPRVARVVVDCSQLDFFDSSGLGALIHIHNLLADHQRPVRLSKVGPKMLTLLEMMQVHRIFDLEQA